MAQNFLMAWKLMRLWKNLIRKIRNNHIHTFNVFIGGVNEKAGNFSYTIQQLSGKMVINHNSLKTTFLFQQPQTSFAHTQNY